MKILLILYMFFLTGCGILNYHINSVRLEAERIKETRERLELEYIGKKSEALLNAFKEPMVKRLVFRNGVEYDEQWCYRRSKSVQQTNRDVCFYIENTIIGLIDVF